MIQALASRFRTRETAAQSLSLSFADMHLRLWTDDPEMLLEPDEVGARFAAAGYRPDLNLRAAWADLSNFAPGRMVFDSGPLWQLYECGTRYAFRFCSPAYGAAPYKVALIDSDLSSGEILIHHPYFVPCREVYPLEYPLDELLAIHLLSRGRGIILHACGLVDEFGQGHLFIGQSGAGKSTTARLWRRVAGASVLSDDRIIVREQGGGFRIHGTPWHGDVKAARPVSAPLSGIYFLTQGWENRLTPVKRSDAVARAFAAAFVPFQDPDAVAFALEFGDALFARVPAHDLTFLPNTGAVSLVMDAGRGRRA